MKSLFPIFFIIGIILSAGPAKAQSYGPVPVTPSEQRFYNFLYDLAEIDFGDTLPTDPWIQCDDQQRKRTFFSASLYQFTNVTDISSNIQAWFSSFLDHAYWGSVDSATCQFEINHFNECFASGKFTVSFRYKRIISFRVDTYNQYCE